MVCVIVLTGVSVSAHDLWVTGKNEEVFKADMIYGHDFPHPEIIVQERTVLFDPVQVEGENLHEILTPKKENYHSKEKHR